MDARGCGRGLVGVLVFLVGAAGWGEPAVADAADEKLRAGLEAIAAGENERAARILGGLVADHPTAECAARAMCAAGQALLRLDRHGEALEFFQSALEREDATLRRGPLYLAAGLAAFEDGQYAEAVRLCRRSVDSGADARRAAAAYPLLIRSLEKLARFEEAWEAIERAAEVDGVRPQELDELALSVGMEALQQNDAPVAVQIFAWAGNRGRDREFAGRAAWGLAWAEALSASTPEESAARLLAFAETAAEPQEAREARQAAGRYLVVAGKMLAALEALRDGTAGADAESVDGEVWHALATAAGQLGEEMTAAEARGNLLRFHAGHPAATEHAVAAVCDAARADDRRRWDAAVAVLSAAGDSGAVRAALAALGELDDGAGSGSAERLADALLRESAARAEASGAGGDGAPVDDGALVDGVVCRWLAEAGGWKRLAEADAGDSSRGPAARRWIAEALYRLGRGEEAFARFTALADAPLADADARAVALRTAELAARFESREASRRWIERAAGLAADASERAAVDLIAAEVAVRAAAFSEARALLEAVAREPAVAPKLAARAQWMIGETWFLQERFGEALESYRAVESMPEAEPYQPLALLQAGKCFERLGRPREAVICYSELLSHPGGAAHAEVARERLATLQGPAANRR